MPICSFYDQISLCLNQLEDLAMLNSYLVMERIVPIFDGDLSYDCPHTGKVYFLVLRNALHIPSMDHNLIPFS